MIVVSRETLAFSSSFAPKKSTGLEVDIVVLQTHVVEVLEHAHEFSKVRFEVIDLLVSLGHAEFLRERSEVILSAGKDA